MDGARGPSRIVPTAAVFSTAHFRSSPVFERLRAQYIDDDQYRLLQATLMANPGSGAVTPGAGGVRKVRWAADGRGKRGGLRVIYYWITRVDTS
jgi:hypothetical protein